MFQKEQKEHPSYRPNNRIEGKKYQHSLQGFFYIKTNAEN